MVEISKILGVFALGRIRLGGAAMRSFALALVLFALTLRAALPLGLSVVVGEDGIPLVMCQQVAQVQAILSGEEDDSSLPTAPGYQCPFCMVISADNAPLPVVDFPHFGALRVEVIRLALPTDPGILLSDPAKDDNLGRDPPFV